MAGCGSVDGSTGDFRSSATSTWRTLAGEAHEVICFQRPTHLGAIDQFSDPFDRVSDEEVLACLKPADETAA